MTSANSSTQAPSVVDPQTPSGANAPSSAPLDGGVCCIAPPDSVPIEPLPSPHLPPESSFSYITPPPPAAPPPVSRQCCSSPCSSSKSTPIHRPRPVTPKRQIGDSSYPPPSTPPPPLPPPVEREEQLLSASLPPVADHLPCVGRPSRPRVVFDPNIVSMETSGGDINAAHDGSLEEIERGPGDLPLSSLGNSLRYQMPRLSLLGKPLQMKTGLLRGNQDARYRRLQATVYNFLERPKSWQAITYHVFVFASVFVCLIFSVLSTIPAYSSGAGETLFYMELCMLFWFFSEYCLRLWSAGCRSRYQSWRGRAKFARRPFCIVDIIVILASIVVLAMGSDRQMFAASALRGLRFFQILRMIRMDRRGGSWKLLASVVWAHRQELFTTIYIGFLGLIFSSFLIYLVEKGKNDKIKTYADALWWGVNTFCTVGYGETIPESWLGKLIAGASCLAIISFYALPPGILGSGFALKVQQHQRQKHLIRRRVPAASLIQCLWRCYAADPNSTSIATWKPHMKPLRSPPTSRTFGRFSTIRRKTSDKSSIIGSSARRNALHETDQLSASNASEILSSQRNRSSFSYGGSPLSSSPVNRSPSNELGDSGGRRLRERFRAVAQSFRWAATPNRQRWSHMSLPTYEASSKDGMAMSLRDDEDDNEVVTLLKKHKDAIRAIRKIKFFVARKKFREALRPYDVKDVIEQYSAGHVDMLARIKGLQNRLDLILGRQGTKEVYESKTSLATRIVKVEHRVEDIETKLDWFIEQYKNDRVLLLRESRTALYSNSTSSQAALPPPHPPPPPPPSTTTNNSDTKADDEAQDQSSPLPNENNSSLNQLRSILVASPATALPSSPLVKQTPPEPPPRPFGIHRRNYSDLGPRLSEAPSLPAREGLASRRSTSQQHKKKRVTYRCASEQDERSAHSSPGLVFDVTSSPVRESHQIFTFPTHGTIAEHQPCEQLPPPPPRRLVRGTEMDEEEVEEGVEEEEEEDEVNAETTVEHQIHYRPESQPLLMATEVQKMKKSTC